MRGQGADGALVGAPGAKFKSACVQFSHAQAGSLI